MSKIIKKIKKLIKKIKKFLIRIINWIKYKINPKLVDKKTRNKIKMEKEISSHYSFRGNILRKFVGLGNLCQE